MRDCSRGPGAMCTAPLPAPSTAEMTNGMVKMPARLEPTVSSSASAVLPPTACKVRADLVIHLSWRQVLLCLSNKLL